MKPKLEVKNYRYILRLKKERTYIAKDGETKIVDTLFAADLEQSTLLPDSLQLTFEGTNGQTRKRTIAKDQIAEIEDLGTAENDASEE